MVGSELRIGNYVLTDKNMFCEIKEISHIRTVLVSQLDFWKDDTLFGFTIEQLKPITLSEEILLKCGAKKMPSSSEWKYIIRISAAKLLIRFSNGIAYMEFNDTYLGDMIKTVHHLQNFCSVFGKELEIEL